MAGNADDIERVGVLRSFTAWAVRVADEPHADPALALRRIAEEARITLQKTERTK